MLRALSLALVAALTGAFIAAVTIFGSIRSDYPSPCGESPYAEFQTWLAPRLYLEVARTPEERALGLMFRESLEEDWGMLFVFERPGTGGFWMKDTLIPLSIAFVSEDGLIVDIQDMQPLTLEGHSPAQPYVHAIEADQGWFQARGIEPGVGVYLCLEHA